jgi:predicted deacetylase
VRWIGGRVADGAEVLLHGARHDEVGVRRGVADHWRAAGRTDGEGEFLTLDRAMARGRIAEGLDGLERLGLRAVGFVPPAWLTSRDTWRAVADCGLAVSEGADGVVALPGQRVVRAPAVRWSARTRWRAAGSMWVATARRRWHADAPLVRVALHPRDLHHAGVAASLRSALEWWRRHRAPTRYLAVAEQAA